MKFSLDVSLRVLIETLTGDFEKLKWILIDHRVVQIVEFYLGMLVAKGIHVWILMTSCWGVP